MIRELELLGFLVLGLVGGFGHCLGMCAPFVLWVSDRFGAPDAPAVRRLVPQLLYGLGRMTTYAALGAAAGLLGGVVQLAGGLVGVQSAAALVAGGLLVLYAAVGLADVVPALRPRPSGGGLFARVAGRLRGRQPRHPYLAGLFLGLLPCGLVYGALIAAAGTGGVGRAAVALALFGLGTLPALLALALVSDLLRKYRAVLNALGLVFVLGMGLWFLVGGIRGFF